MTFSLPAADEKADYVQKQFNRIARRYDLSNDAISLGMHRFWKQKAVKALEIRPDGNYLDVCCGTGDLTERMAKSLSSGGKVVGIDFSCNMIDAAQTRWNRANRSAQASQVVFLEGDALKLPFVENQFDGAVISFGLRNLTDYAKGLTEMARVVKSGGKVVNLDLGRPENWLFKPAYYFYFCNIVPLIGQLLQNDREAYTYLPKSLDTYPQPAGITQLFSQVGLADIRYIPLAMGSVALHVGTKL
jgi:demethylmenaquinone methyltransferase/2-methoxy-6-polyprenyl-1,4-benzoquinol methylase